MYYQQKLADDKVRLYQRRDALKKTVQQLTSQYESLKAQLNENDAYVQVSYVRFQLSEINFLIIFMILHLVSLKKPNNVYNYTA